MSLAQRSSRLWKIVWSLPVLIKFLIAFFFFFFPPKLVKQPTVDKCICGDTTCFIGLEATCQNNWRGGIQVMLTCFHCRKIKNNNKYQPIRLAPMPLNKLRYCNLTSQTIYKRDSQQLSAHMQFTQRRRPLLVFPMDKKTQTLSSNTVGEIHPPSSCLSRPLALLLALLTA